MNKDKKKNKDEMSDKKLHISDVRNCVSSMLENEEKR